MNKKEFLELLRKELSSLPQEDIEERLTFYGEMIDDRVEEGISEDEAVEKIGSVEKIVSQIIADIPLAKLVKEKIKPKKRLSVWEIVLLVLGSPIWLSLLVAAFAVILSVYISLWAVIICLWAVFVSFVGCAIGAVICGIGFACQGNLVSGISMISASIICAGLSIFSFFGSLIATKGILLLTKKIILSIKKCFIGKEEA